MKPVLIIAIVFSIAISLVGVVAMTNTTDDTSAARDAAAEKAAADKAAADKAAADKVAKWAADEAAASKAWFAKAQAKAAAEKAAADKVAKWAADEAAADKVAKWAADEAAAKAESKSVTQQTIDDARAESVAKAVAGQKRDDSQFLRVPSTYKAPDKTIAEIYEDRKNSISAGAAARQVASERSAYNAPAYNTDKAVEERTAGMLARSAELKAETMANVDKARDKLKSQDNNLKSFKDNKLDISKINPNSVPKYTPPPPSNNPAKQFDNSNPGRDIVLSRENPGIPSSAWNP